MPAPASRALCRHMLDELSAMANAENVAGMARFGISTTGTLGVPMPDVRRVAREAKRQLGRDREACHQLAGLLWESGVHEARIAASLVDDPGLVDDAQMERWAADLDSWDVCDTLCNNLFRRSAPAWSKAVHWPARNEEFVKRAGFVLGATLAVHDKAAEDGRFVPLLALGRAGMRRRPQLREEGGQLADPPDREAQCRPERRGDRRVRAHPGGPPRECGCTLDGARRVTGTAQRRRPMSARARLRETRPPRRFRPAGSSPEARDYS